MANHEIGYTFQNSVNRCEAIEAIKKFKKKTKLMKKKTTVFFISGRKTIREKFI